VAGNELGIVERRLGKFAEAEAAYQRTIAAEPNYAPAHLNLGVLYDLYLAQPQKALDEFERYIEIAGENKQVAGWVVELRKRVGAPAPPAGDDPEGARMKQRDGRELDGAIIRRRSGVGAAAGGAAPPRCRRHPR